jgi:hypothetical protein
VKDRSFYQRRVIILLIIVVALASFGPVRRALYYGAFQRGTCTILEQRVRTIQGPVTAAFAPYVRYAVYPANGNVVQAEGFDGPESRIYRKREEVNALLARFQPGKATPCWYDPADPTHAFLVFQGYTFQMASGQFFFYALVFALFVPILFLCLEWLIWRFLVLRFRGVVVIGAVVKTEVKPGRSFLWWRGEPFSEHTILYKARGRKGGEDTVRYIKYVSTPLEEREFVDWLKVPICYDPRQPRYDRFGDRPPLYFVLPGLVIGLPLLAMLLSFLYDIVMRIPGFS